MIEGIQVGFPLGKMVLRVKGNTIAGECPMGPVSGTLSDEGVLLEGRGFSVRLTLEEFALLAGNKLMYDASWKIAETKLSELPFRNQLFMTFRQGAEFLAKKLRRISGYDH
jgi:hypothetical protein